jgi:hypothetical protein
MFGDILMGAPTELDHSVVQLAPVCVLSDVSGIGQNQHDGLDQPDQIDHDDDDDEPDEVDLSAQP